LSSLFEAPFSFLAQKQKKKLVFSRESSLTKVAVHRLDRLTSGLLLFARNSKKADELVTQLRNGQVEKVYLARVAGNFPQYVSFEFARNAVMQKTATIQARTCCSPICQRPNRSQSAGFGAEQTRRPL
jgi:23S rRNA-/tRNA-specific pseudouridylate synthase